ncbi:MAG: hypothetical protein ACHQIL_00510 [Steroidobacterales bacterium]
MIKDQAAQPGSSFGSWDDAVRLRRWAFLQRTPQQRLDWLVQALELAYQSGAIEAKRVNGS